LSSSEQKGLSDMTDIQSLLALGVYLFILFVVMYRFVAWVFSQTPSENKTPGARTRIDGPDD